MRIKSLWISEYKNLKDFTIEFDTSSPLNIIIGANGSGKSNFLEALALIFKGLIDKKYDFEFIIDGEKQNLNFAINYSRYDSDVEIKCEDKKMTIKVNNLKMSIKDFEKKNILPYNFFGYYAGFNERLAKLFEEKRIDLYKKSLLRGDEIRLDRLFLLNVNLSKLSFLTHFVYKKTLSFDISDILGIEKVENVLIKFKSPQWAKKSTDIFYGAKGSSRDFLNFLEKNINKNQFKFNKSGNVESIEIRELSDLYNIELRAQEYFANLNALYIFEMIDDIEIKFTKGNKLIPFEALSEGEMQMVLLLSFLSFSTELPTLFLLDEPDSFLHPKWQREFSTLIEKLNFEGQIFMTTHSPLTLGKVKRESIKIFKDGKVYVPSSDSMNRDVSDILEEIMGVEPRPKEIQEKINEFYEAIAHLDKNRAKEILRDLSSKLSESDQFLIESKMLLDGDEE